MKRVCYEEKRGSVSRRSGEMEQQDRYGQQDLNDVVQQQPQQYIFPSHNSKANNTVSSSSSCNSHQQPHQPTRMISFIDSLYSKYKILNLLSQQQSNNFQTQIITMLIDENECLDLQLYKQTVQKIGLSTFILEILAIVMQKRNKYKNQYEMSKNIETITKEFDKQRVELVRRKKQLEKKQLMINQQKSVLMTVLQEKAKQVEEKTIAKLIEIEQQIKKRVKQSICTLKNKQKQVVDKVSSLRDSLKKVKQLQTQQSKIQQKMKLLQRKEKQRKSKQSTDRQQLLTLQQSTKKQQQLTTKINTLQQMNIRLQQQITKLNKKIKTNQMASKHYKEELEKKMTKWSEMGERVRVLEGEKTELQKQKMLLQERMLQLEQGSTNKQRIRQKQSQQLFIKSQQLNKLSIQLKQRKQTISQLTKQNQTLLLKLKQLSSTTSSSITTTKSTTINNNSKILPQFQYLDISKIEQMEILARIPEFKGDTQSKRKDKIQHESQQQQQQQQHQSPSTLQEQSIIEQVFLHRRQTYQEQYSHSISRSIIVQDSKVQLFDNYFNINIQKSSLTTTNSITQDMLKEINHYLLKAGESESKQMQCQYLSNLSQQIIINWISTISSQIKQRKPLIQPLLQLLLCILEPCTCTYHTNTLPLLYTPIVITFLQQVFLKYEAITPTIQQKALIIISRILLSYQSYHKHNDSLNSDNDRFTLTESYLKSLKVKLLIQKDEFILSNIKFLIDYNL